MTRSVDNTKKYIMRYQADGTCGKVWRTTEAMDAEQMLEHVKSAFQTYGGLYPNYGIFEEVDIFKRA